MRAAVDFFGLARRSIAGWNDDNASSMGAALAFYTLFSLAPLLLVAVAIAGVFVGRSEAQQALVDQLSTMIGVNAALAVDSLLEAAGSARDGALPAAIGFAALAFAATRVFAELRASLNRVWRVHPQTTSGIWNFVTTRILAFGMVLAVGFLLLVSLAASALIEALGESHGFEFGASILVLMALFAMIYKFMPGTRVAWRDVWVGAAVTSVLFWVGKLAIAIYIGHTAIASSFGAAGALVVVIAWVYYSTLIFFLGAEFTREYALSHGSRQNEPQLRERRRTPGIAANDEQMNERVTSGP
jgi:membrane protein